MLGRAWGGSDALLALLVGIGPKSVRRASRSSPSSWAIFSAPKLRSAVTLWSRGACMKAFSAVPVAMTWRGKAGQCWAVRDKRENEVREQGCRRKLQCIRSFAQSECIKKASAIVQCKSPQEELDEEVGDLSRQGWG